jgi:flagellar L-ring protein precursor FlgH
MAMHTSFRSLIRATAVTSLSFSLGACTAFANRVSQIGEAPPMSPIVVPASDGAGATTPASSSAVLPVSSVGASNALWKAGSRSFFRDPRAAKVGDILTVNIDIGDQAKIDNNTSRSRSNSESANAKSFLGLESKLSNILPKAVDPSSLVDMGSDTSNKGSGSVDRSESIKLTVAAVVRQVLSNGNLVIEGSQEVRVNYEKRVLNISGIVRPEDISNSNTINHTQIAEARISYGGEGQITDVQQPRYGQQLYDILFPF